MSIPNEGFMAAARLNAGGWAPHPTVGRVCLAVFFMLLWGSVAMAADVSNFDKGRVAYHAKDYAMAVKWYQRAAKQGDASAQYNLGLMYANGRGVKQSDAEAVRLFRLTAKQGDAFAKRHLPIAEYSLQQRRLHPHALKLFGVPLVGAQRNELRTALKKAGVRALREKYSYWADQYDPSGILNGADNLYVEYSQESDANGWGSTDYFAVAQYRFPSSMDSGQVTRIRDMVASKYGSPNQSSGNPNLGKASFTWHEDGVDIWVYRRWPDTTTYLEYIVPEINKAMNAEIAANNRRTQQKKFKAQSNAF